ncbi:MAG: AAA family ATPase [Gammaproteobacteria bacterium]|nr:AAA family ATPase [Gammaproteobacteria bacterium]
MALRKSRTTPEKPWPSLRLAKITVENYKSLDKLELELPAPSTADQLDAFVLGSKNGVGKSSLLECCALALIGAVFPELLQRDHRPRAPLALHNLLIRSGADKATIHAQISVDRSAHEVGLELGPSGFKPHEETNPRKKFDSAWRHNELFEEGELLDSLLGMNSEPLIVPPVLLFHSYRKVLEGSSALGAMVDPTFARRGYPPRRFGGPGPLSTFKVVLVQALMTKSGLFEGMDSKSDNQAILDRLNGLIRDFAGGTVDKLRPGPDGTLELRVTPVGGGASFSFDGLSSGQKEIIATLFLVWYMTQERPSIVLIDEPELHLNAEWQRIFVRKLAEMAPKNQYILATHSEEIFGSVTEDRRVMLQRG